MRWAAPGVAGRPAPRRDLLPAHPGPVLPAELHVGKVWGTITAGAQRRGRPRPLTDTWIAACCIHAGLPLLTRNRRDFADYADHDGLMLLDG